MAVIMPTLLTCNMPVPACRGVWRNGLLFNPTVKYGEYSYADIMLMPLAEALRDSLAAVAKLGKLVTPPDRTRPVVYFAMTGEDH
jgi:hypothetical protein